VRVTFLVIALSMPPPVLAATTQLSGSQAAEGTSAGSPAQLQEVVVTAQKRTERLQNVPISISVLGGGALDRSTFQGVSEALNSVPGVATTDVYLGGGTNIEIRGVGATSPFYTGPSTVAYYLDSVPFGLVKSAVGPDADVYDLQRVEVLRGPQGTLYGSSALNGVVRILTSDPDLNDFDLSSRAGDSGTTDGGDNYRGDAMINMPIVQGALAARAVVSYLHDSGWIDQPGKSNANDTDVGTYRLKVAAQPMQDFSVGLSAWSSRQNSDGPNLGYAFDRNASQLAQPTSTAYDAYGLKMDYKLRWFSVSSATSYLDYRNYGYLGLDVTGFGVPGGEYFSQLSSYVASEELNLTSTLSGPWHWSLGGIYRKGTEDGAAFFTVIPLGGGVYTDRSDSYAIYGELTRSLLDDRLELTVGLRHFHDALSQNGLNTPPAPVLTGAAAATSANAEANTPRAVVAWHLDDQMMLYGSYSQGFRSGFPQQTGVLQADPEFPQAKPDRLTNYELGAKGTLMQGRVVVDTSVYHIVWNGIQLLVEVPINDLPYPGVVNGARATGDGVDFSVVTKLSERVTLSPYVSWNNLAVQGNVLSNGVVLYHGGDRPSGSVGTTAGLALEYSFPMGAAVGTFSASGNYTSPQSYRTIAPTGLLVQDSNAIVIARARFAVDYGQHWTVALYGDNLGNFRGVTAVMYPGVVPNWEGRLRPLTIGLEMQYRLR
jgi:iron complex outermembrane recepter protein